MYSVLFRISMFTLFLTFDVFGQSTTTSTAATTTLTTTTTAAPIITPQVGQTEGRVTLSGTLWGFVSINATARNQLKLTVEAALTSTLGAPVTVTNIFFFEPGSLIVDFIITTQTTDAITTKVTNLNVNTAWVASISTFYSATTSSNEVLTVAALRISIVQPVSKDGCDDRCIGLLAMGAALFMMLVTGTVAAYLCCIKKGKEISMEGQPEHVSGGQEMRRV